MFEELLELYKSKLAEKEKDLRGYQAMIQLVTTIEKISQETLSPQSNLALLKKLEDQVSRQSKELRDLKAELMAGKGISPPAEKQKSKALDGHAWDLIDLLKKKQGSCTTNELVEMLGLNKTTVISVMKRAIALDPDHLKMTTGKRRKLYLAYVP
jgi:uncharacterized membrane protein